MNIENKETRKKIYLALAKRYATAIKKGKGDAREIVNILCEKHLEFICLQLNYHCPYTVKKHGLRPWISETKFPELMLFKPEEDCHDGGGWFPRSTVEGYEERLTVLLLCAEMCK